MSTNRGRSHTLSVRGPSMESSCSGPNTGLDVAAVGVDGISGFVEAGIAGLCPSVQFPRRLERQMVHGLPAWTQTHFLRRPLLLHRQHAGMMISQMISQITRIS